MYYPRFTKAIIHHFITKDKSISMRNKMFMHTALDDSILGSMRFVSKPDDFQVYRALLPEVMTNQKMWNSPTYKTYLAYATGVVLADQRSRRSIETRGGDGDESNGEERGIATCLKDTCNSYWIRLQLIEECYRALFEQLDWNNPEGHLGETEASSTERLVEYLRGRKGNDKNSQPSITKSKATSMSFKGQLSPRKAINIVMAEEVAGTNQWRNLLKTSATGMDGGRTEMAGAEEGVTKESALRARARRALCRCVAYSAFKLKNKK
ncbi:hypothetical protein Tco_1079472 [Tanacetum coccineum]|uniref:Uncharacterized protein n=1 Tax=Tanacetum coccineum TaxID=301880 RepID=A0ABQ5HTN0_9ASTR